MIHRLRRGVPRDGIRGAIAVVVVHPATGQVGLVPSPLARPFEIGCTVIPGPRPSVFHELLDVLLANRTVRAAAAEHGTRRVVPEDDLVRREVEKVRKVVLGDGYRPLTSWLSARWQH